MVACESGPGEAKEPPVLKVMSPARSLIQDHAGQITVSGTVEPNPKGDPVDKVLVNNVEATLEKDGSFHALIDVGEGATLIQTVAHDIHGSTVSDTRAVQAGQLRPVGSNIDHAIAAALSADAFTKISAAAGPIIKGMNMQALLAPLQPMVSVGGSSTYAHLFVDNLRFGDVKISLAPVAGGLSFRAEIDQLDVPAHASFAVLSIGGSDSLRVTADKVVVAGTLDVAPAGMAGFTTKIVSPNVQITNFHLTAGGIPQTIINLLDLNSAISFIVSKGAELAMSPLVNHALGALTGPQKLDVLGHKLDLQVAPSAVAFTPTGAVVAMNLKALLEGSESSPGFIFTDNGQPAMDPGHGIQIGLADDLLNELLAEVRVLGLLDLSMPNDAGAFDTAQIHMTLPPMISADASDGTLHLVLGDMVATFTSKGTPVARAAINARVDLAIAPVAGGGSVALQLGTPDIHVDTLDDIANATGLTDTDLSAGVRAGIGSQLDAITKLLVSVPVPAIAGLQLQNLAIGSDDGYVVLSGQLQ
ncbi:MAG TPA: hypothetical protein VF469_09365 [Kofleriaceae bacterium]